MSIWIVGLALLALALWAGRMIAEWTDDGDPSRYDNDD